MTMGNRNTADLIKTIAIKGYVACSFGIAI